MFISFLIGLMVAYVMFGLTNDKVWTDEEMQTTIAHYEREIRRLKEGSNV